MHTEQQTKGLWCPMVRPLPLSQGESYQGSSTQDSIFNAQCIASECAMWRWVWVGEHGKHEIHSLDGYCGLAGPINFQK